MAASLKRSYNYAKLPIAYNVRPPPVMRGCSAVLVIGIRSIWPASILLCSPSVLVRTISLAVLLGAAAFAQPADINGWNGLRWGVKKTDALNSLRTFHARSAQDSVAVEDY